MPHQAHSTTVFNVARCFNAAADTLRSIGRLKQAVKRRNPSQLARAIAEYRQQADALAECSAVICDHASLIDQARSSPFHWDPELEDPYLVWTPCLYATLCFCEEVLDPILRFHELKGHDLAAARPELHKALAPFSEGFLLRELHFEETKYLAALATQPPPDRARGKRRRMTRKAANEEAMRLGKRHKKRFFNLSMTEQAQKIGCHLNTWKRTPFFQTAQLKREKLTKQGEKKSRSPKAVSLTDGLEATLGEGDRDEVVRNLTAEQEAVEATAGEGDRNTDAVEATAGEGDRDEATLSKEERAEALRKLTAEQKADDEPSPLDPGSKKVRQRKRL
jgi:hypothetical protein